MGEDKKPLSSTLLRSLPGALQIRLAKRRLTREQQSLLAQTELMHAEKQ